MVQVVKVLESWRPAWAPHVEGRYEPRLFDPETQLPEPQRVWCRCEKCGAQWQTSCSSGQVRRHIQTFANVHLHRDPMEQKTPDQGAT